MHSHRPPTPADSGVVGRASAALRTLTDEVLCSTDPSVLEVRTLHALETPASCTACRRFPILGRRSPRDGRVVTVAGDITQADVATQVTSGLHSGGEVRVFSGAHGTPGGALIPEASFFTDDVARFGDIPGVTVQDVTKMGADQISGAMQSPGTTIGAFCNSGPCLEPFK